MIFSLLSGSQPYCYVTVRAISSSSGVGTLSAPRCPSPWSGWASWRTSCRGRASGHSSVQYSTPSTPPRHTCRWALRQSVNVRWNLASNILLLAFGIKYFLPENAWRRVHEFPVSVQVVITGAGGAGHVPGGARQLHEELHVLGHHQHDLRIPAAAAADRGQAIGCDCDSEKRWYTTHVGDT